MILILSSNTDEESTNQVIDWLNFLGASYHRVNGVDLEGESDNNIVIKIDDLDLNSLVEFKDNSINDKEITVIWNRKWRYGDFHNYLEVPSLDEYQRAKVADHLINEYYASTKALLSVLESKQWLTKPPYFRGLATNKFQVLKEAAKLGLRIPKTLITNSKEELSSFLSAEQNVITKSVSDVDVFVVEEKGYAHYTAHITEGDLKKIPDKFFPSLFQKMIEKEYEIRTFFLDGEFYSMAMFSQSDEQTKTDFRHYNIKRPSRRVPYALPSEVESKLLKLLDHLELNCASIDLIKSKDGAYYFLEINITGQFGMVSIPCNYYLEEKVANYLNNEDKKKKRTTRKSRLHEVN